MPKPVALVIGASRGIGRQIAIDLARNGYAVVVAAKSTEAQETDLPPSSSKHSTITSVTREINDIHHGTATAIPVDTRSITQIDALFAAVERLHGRLDVLIYNAGAIWWSAVESTPVKRFQLMQRVNPEGLYASIQAALPLFARNAWRGRIVVVSPPIYSRFFRGKTAYAMGKVGMSVLTKGLAMDFVRQGRKDMAITSLWPAVSIESAATEDMVRNDPSAQKDLRKPTIFSDAVLAVLNAPAESVNGLLDLDEDFLRRTCGVTDFSKYAVVRGSTPRRIMPASFPVLEVEEQDDEGRRMDSVVLRGKI